MQHQRWNAGAVAVQERAVVVASDASQSLVRLRRARRDDVVTATVVIVRNRSLPLDARAHPSHAAGHCGERSPGRSRAVMASAGVADTTGRRSLSPAPAPRR